MIGDKSPHVDVFRVVELLFGTAECSVYSAVGVGGSDGNHHLSVVDVFCAFVHLQLDVIGVNLLQNLHSCRLSLVAIVDDFHTAEE